jgi:UDP:flavonoid glycosyltransferase YjiC (YdhE family)
MKSRIDSLSYPKGYVPDVIISSDTSMIHISQKFQIPVQFVFISQFFMNCIQNILEINEIFSLTNKFRRILNLSPIESLENFVKFAIPTPNFKYNRKYFNYLNIPVIQINSKHLLKYKDYGENLKIVGYWFLEEKLDYKPPSDLIEIAKEKPLYFGFGSMNSSNIDEIFKIIIEVGKIIQKKNYYLFRMVKIYK